MAERDRDQEGKQASSWLSHVTWKLSGFLPYLGLGQLGRHSSPFRLGVSI